MLHSTIGKFDICTWKNDVGKGSVYPFVIRNGKKFFREVWSRDKAEED